MLQLQAHPLALTLESYIDHPFSEQMLLAVNGLIRGWAIEIPIQEEHHIQAMVTTEWGVYYPYVTTQLAGCSCEYWWVNGEKHRKACEHMIAVILSHSIRQPLKTPIEGPCLCIPCGSLYDQEINALCPHCGENEPTKLVAKP